MKTYILVGDTFYIGFFSQDKILLTPFKEAVCFTEKNSEYVVECLLKQKIFSSFCVSFVGPKKSIKYLLKENPFAEGFCYSIF